MWKDISMANLLLRWNCWHQASVQCNYVGNNSSGKKNTSEKKGACYYFFLGGGRVPVKRRPPVAVVLRKQGASSIGMEGLYLVWPISMSIPGKRCQTISKVTLTKPRLKHFCQSSWKNLEWRRCGKCVKKGFFFFMNSSLLRKMIRGSGCIWSSDTPVAVAFAKSSSRIPQNPFCALCIRTSKNETYQAKFDLQNATYRLALLCKVLFEKIRELLWLQFDLPSKAAFCWRCHRFSRFDLKLNRWTEGPELRTPTNQVLLFLSPLNTTSTDQWAVFAFFEVLFFLSSRISHTKTAHWVDRRLEAWWRWRWGLVEVLSDIEERLFYHCEKVSKNN